ncbi:hypothetical protein ACVWZR_009546 [Bradyrhizobium sp. i1.3.1]
MMELAAARMPSIWVDVTAVFCEIMSATLCAVALTLTFMASPFPSSTPPT